MTPEARARQTIDALLTAAGWHVCNVANANLRAATGVAIREFPLNTGHGFADYLLYVNGKACGVIEAKKEGATLSGVEVQSARYAQGLPAALPAWRRPLPFVFESTGVETRFTNGLDPAPRACPLFAFFQPELLLQWLAYLPPQPQGNAAGDSDQAPTFLARLQHMPPLVTEWGQGGASYQLWPAQIKAIQNLETSLAANKPKALIQMATGSGKTFTAISFIYRLIKFGGARRVLFLVDRGNLARQTKKEFDAYASPHNAYKFGEEFIVQHLQGNQLDGSARVVICTIQRMFSMLKGKELPEEADEVSTEGAEALFKDPEPIGYNPAIPIESFDIVVTDEAHRSIYNLWRQVLEYFDAYLIGLTATPNKQTFGFFNQNLVMEYGHAQAVADGVNVNYDVYRIKTEVTEAGARVDKGYWLETQDKATRRKTAWQLDEDFEYDPTELDRAVQTPDQIRTVVRTLRDQWRVDLFPHRQELPKTLIFAKDDNHAEKIVEILREEFARGNEFAQKITYRTTGASPEQLIKDFRTAYYPRIAVTVDMIATGTDIKPVEIVMFMRSVKSRSFFEQMKGRGVRVCQPTDLMAVNPGEQPPHNQPSIVPAGYGWPELLARDGDALFDHYRHTLERLGLERGTLGLIFAKAQNKFQDPAKLRRVVADLIDAETWTILGADVKGDAYEGLLERNAQDTKSGAGQYFTPRALIQAMVDCIAPQPGETICDPACGTGGFLFTAHNHITAHHKNLTRDQLKHLKEKAFTGYELVQATARVCAMNLMLHGIGSEKSVPVVVGDALGADPGARFDVVLANPPFGKKSSTLIVGEDGRTSTEKDIIERDDFWATTSNKQLNFVQHIKTLLATHGRAAVVLPDNVLFEGGAGETIRRRLLQECDLHTLLRLPTGLFYAQGVKANVLFFDKRPASETPWTKQLWIYDLRTNQHFTLKTNPLKREHLDEFVALFQVANRHLRQPTWSPENPDGRWRVYGYDELVARDKASLDIFWLKDESLADSDNLPPPDVIAQEIVEDLQAALDQFKLIATDLSPADTTVS